AFVALHPNDYKFDPRNKTFDCGSTLPDGINGEVPRPTGRLIAIDYDAASSTEYVYVATSQGVARTRDGGTTFSVIGPKAPDGAYSAVALHGGALYVSTFRKSTTTTGSQFYRIDTPRGVASVVTLTSSAPAEIEDLDDINGTLYAAA